METKISIYLTCKTSGMRHHFVFTTKTTRTRLQVFSVTRLIIWQFCCTTDITISSHFCKILLNSVDGFMIKYSWDQF